MNNSTDTLFALLPRFNTVVRCYTRSEAVAHFVAFGDPNPAVYECGVQWANANNGEAVWSREAALAGKLRGELFANEQDARNAQHAAARNRTAD